MGRRRLELVLDLTSRCNIRCVMCYFSVIDRIRFQPFDLDPGPHGDMDPATYRHVASELFPRARTVVFGCSAEPLIHPDFCELLEATRSHRVPRVSLQTNLLALSPARAEAVVAAGVHTIAVSVDGTCRETYEKIRRGASWDRLLSRLELLRAARAASGSRWPRLRITFAWMRSNRHELATLPAFAAAHGASELDVRFVVPTVGVDNSGELLDDDGTLTAELWSVARDATRRGIRLSAYPAMAKEADADDSFLAKLRRRLWLLRSGIDGPHVWRRAARARLVGCAFPGKTLLIRPNGSVLPCAFWEEQPIAIVPRDDRRAILGSDALTEIRRGLQRGCPAGSCRTCTEKKDALFRPFTGTGTAHHDAQPPGPEA
jgi:MoaA/NifB/PqqE/SkfB family radical SAM enzyme